MPDAIELRTDGPHNPEYTRQVAGALAEAVRVLNYATRDGAPGLEYPGDLYDLLGNLVAAISRFPQLTGQSKSFLATQAASGTLGESQGRDVTEQAAMAAFALGGAGALAEELAGVLQQAQNAIAGLYVKDVGDA